MATEVLIGARPGGSASGTAVIDPTGVAKVPAGLSWRCEHGVTFVALSELSRLLCLTGDVAGAMRATELRGMLPISDRLREHLAFEAGALQAMFNQRRSRSPGPATARVSAVVTSPEPQTL